MHCFGPGKLLMMMFTAAVFGAHLDVALAAKTKTPRTSARVPAITAEAVNAAEDPLLREGAAGPAVARAQVLLDRAQFSSGEIDGHFRSNMRRAVAGFQRTHGLQPSGVIDGDTWNALRADGASPLTNYAITEADVAGPFADIPNDIMQRAAMHALPYRNVLEALGEKFHVNPNVLRGLNIGKALAQGVEIVVPNVLGDPGPAHGSRIIIDKKERVLVVADAKNVALAQFPISTGNPKDVLPRGRYKITTEVKNPVFYYDPAKIRTSKQSDQRAKIAPGPNNPVGVMWLGLTKPHYGLHGTPEPSKVGHEETSGCIHLTNWDITRLSALVSRGTVVEVVN